MDSYDGEIEYKLIIIDSKKNNIDIEEDFYSRFTEIVFVEND
jgi:hypothetical protein